ncbi:MAG: agmatine deiminase family protein [Chromatiaceae bacterium]|nr:agmatine deiminase family protein [Chromatiaceae bacterium]MCF7995031.1 agmatine deiminase family protein [Chromatiaceae bacterium]MCF8015063.1 agmatine deiminase family protein [Chromatiaceae bacterium]
MRHLPAEWEPQQAVILTWPHADTDWAAQLDAVEAIYRRLAQLITADQDLLIICRDEAHRRAIQAQLNEASNKDYPAVGTGTEAEAESTEEAQAKPETEAKTKFRAKAGTRGQTKRIRFAVAPSNDTWARDHGPISVIDRATNARVLIDFRFNGWGGKYPAEFDNRITTQVFAAGGFAAPHEAQLDDPGSNSNAHPSASVFRDATLTVMASGQPQKMSRPRFSLDSAHDRLESSSLVLEGGAIESDGAGSLLAVRRTIIDPARNPGWSQTEIEAELRDRLGLERFLWLEHGQLSGDDTDGHIDTLARFCDPQTICYAASDDPNDPDHPALERLAAELRTLRQRNGEPYRLVALPQPAPIHDEDGQRLPAGYANFLIINRAVLVPVYDDPADAIASERLAGCFPGRRIEPVDCRPLIRQGGSLHCITMQLPG